MIKCSKILVYFFTFFVSNFALSQGSLTPDWFIIESSDLEGGNAEAWGIDTDINGDLYWAANVARAGLFQGLDILFYKLDDDGNEIWPGPTLYEAQHNQQAYKVTAANEVVYYTGRDCFQFTLDIELPFCDMLLVAVNKETGDTLWTTTWDQGFGYEEGDGLIIEDDGIYMSGWTKGDTTDMDLALLKVDFNGDILWANTWGSPGRDHQDGHSVVDDSVIYVAGLIGGTLNPGLCLFKDFEGQALLAKFSRETGEYLDHTAFGRDDPWCNFENALGMTSDGDFLYVVGVTTVAENNNEIFLAKYDKNLNRIWHETWGGANTESARAIAIGEDGSIYIGGNTDSFGAGGFDAVILKYTPGGNFVAFKTWGGAAEDQTLDIVIDNNYLYLTGKTKSFNANENFEAVLLKVNLDALVGISSEAPNIQQYQLHQNYPNPFNPTTNIGFQISETGFVELKIYDISGKLVKTLVSDYREPGEYSVSWDGTDDRGVRLSSGVYVYRLAAAEFVESKKFVFVK